MTHPLSLIQRIAYGAHVNRTIQTVEVPPRSNRVCDEVTVVKDANNFRYLCLRYSGRDGGDNDLFGSVRLTEDEMRAVALAILQSLGDPGDLSSQDDG